MKRLLLIAVILTAAPALGWGSQETFGSKISRVVSLAGLSESMATVRELELSTRLYAVTLERDIVLTPEALLSAVVPIIWLTRDIQFAWKNLKNIAVTVQGSGAAPEHIGYMVAYLKISFGIEREREIMTALGDLYAQGEIGPVPLKEFAPFFPRIATAYANTGRKGLGAVREAGAMFQVMSQNKN